MSKAIKIIIGIIIIGGIIYGVDKLAFDKSPISVQTGAAAQQTMKKEFGNVSTGEVAAQKVGNYQMTLKDSGIVDGKGHVTLKIENTDNKTIPALKSSNFVVKAGETVLTSKEASVDISSDNGSYDVGKSYDAVVNINLPTNLQGQSIFVTLSDDGQSQTITPFIGVSKN